jgi:dGTPase
MAHQPSIWSNARLSPGKTKDEDSSDHRTRFQQDYDRILFSTPVRRLSDKTQVFPLDANDAVRTRLTHSHEVANLARSIGNRLHHRKPNLFGAVGSQETIQPILASAGLAHDLGNPPFGHQGEAAIGRWFASKKDWIFTYSKPKGDPLLIDVPERLKEEFLHFDGNPQSLRLMTRLQTSVGKAGLDLTAATLAALIKYPVAAGNAKKRSAADKKYGYFASEASVVEWLRRETGLKEGERHPLTWIMEACDDIAYSVLDVEDSMKKGIISPDDVFSILRCDKDLRKHPAYRALRRAFVKAESTPRSRKVIRDIKIGYLRAHLISALVDHATSTFESYSAAIIDFRHDKALMDDSPLCTRLKDIASVYAFGHHEVLYTEALGGNAIGELMDFCWEAISDRSDSEKIDSRRTTGFARFVYALISPNYIEQATDVEGHGDLRHLGVRYRELRLLTDMVSGMTDGFAMNLRDRIRAVRQ